MTLKPKIIRIPHVPKEPPEDGSIIVCEPVACSFCSTITTLAIVERYVIPSDGWCPHPLCPKHLKEERERELLLKAGIKEATARDMTKHNIDDIDNMMAEHGLKLIEITMRKGEATNLRYRRPDSPVEFDPATRQVTERKPCRFCGHFKGRPAPRDKNLKACSCSCHH